MSELSDRDVDLMARVGATFAEIDPVPEDVLAAARATLGWGLSAATLDAELAELIEDTSVSGMVGIRGTGCAAACHVRERIADRGGRGVSAGRSPPPRWPDRPGRASPACAALPGGRTRRRRGRAGPLRGERCSRGTDQLRLLPRRPVRLAARPARPGSDELDRGLTRPSRSTTIFTTIFTTRSSAPQAPSCRSP